MKVNIGCAVVRTVGGRRSVYGHVITKFSGMGRLPYLWGYAHARASRAREAPLSVFECIKIGLIYVIFLNDEH